MNTATTPKIDLDNLHTDATAAYAFYREEAKEILDKVRADAETTGQKMVKRDLVAAINTLAGFTLAQMGDTKDDLVGQYVDKTVEATHEHKTLAQLRLRAQRDRWMAHHLNRCMEAADQVSGTFSVWGEQDVFRSAREAYDSLGKMFIAVEVARLAGQIVKAVNDGCTDLAGVVEAYVGDALSAIRHFPRTALICGQGGTSRDQSVYEANAAREFANDAARIYSAAYPENKVFFAASIA